MNFFFLVVIDEKIFGFELYIYTLYKYIIVKTIGLHKCLHIA